MVGVETPRSLAVRFIDRPLTYSSTAATFRASGLPRVGVSVKFRPQPLHKERCLVRISPSLTCSSLPQRLHRSPTANLPGDPHQPERSAIYADLKPSLPRMLTNRIGPVLRQPVPCRSDPQKLVALFGGFHPCCQRAALLGVTM